MAKAEEKQVKQSASPPKVEVSKPVKQKVYSFEQWAQIRNKLPRHLRGMKAFLGPDASGYKYPLEKWDEIFKAY